MSTLPPLYLITDRHQLLPGIDLFTVLEELLQAGIKMVQLREKDMSAAELMPLALELRKLTAAFHCKLLINDRIDVAQAVNADGVHLGGHSLPTSVARQILGPDKLIGVSTHNLAEVHDAEQSGADFVTFGPVFFTQSKAAFGEPVGLKNLQEACTISNIPVYGLGGISLDNASETLAAGSHGTAMISTLLCSETPARTCQQLLKILS